jgi:hypothetical protein
VDPTVWIDGMTIGQAKAAPNWNKTQRSLIVSTSKAVSPQAWGMMRPLTYHKFLKKNKDY